MTIATNGTADKQLGKIQRTELAEAMDIYALSGAEGIRKPKPPLSSPVARTHDLWFGVTLGFPAQLLGSTASHCFHRL